MSDLPTAPADAGGAASAPAGGYDDATAVAMLAELEREKRQPAAEPTEQPTEQPSDDGSDAAASEPGDDAAASEPVEGDAAEDEAAAPADDAETGAEAEEPEDKLAHGNMRVGLRDGTVTTVAELRRLADEALEYRAKLPDLTAAAEKARAFETREAQIAQQEQLFQTIVPLAFQRLQSQIPPPPDPALLDENNNLYDPIRYVQEDQRHKAAVAELQNLHATMQDYQQKQQIEAQKLAEADRTRLIEENRKALIEKIPEIADPEKGKAIYDGFVRTATRYGYTKQDVDNVYDHKLLYMIHDLSKKAAAYDKIASQKSVAATKAKSAVPVQQPGRRVSQQEAEQRSYDEQYKRWRENGYSEDGAIALLAQLERGR